MHCQLIIATPSLMVVAVTPGPVPGTWATVAPGPMLGPEVFAFAVPVELAVHPAAASAPTSAAAPTIRRSSFRPRSRVHTPDPLGVKRRELYGFRAWRAARRGSAPSFDGA